MSNKLKSPSQKLDEVIKQLDEQNLNLMALEKRALELMEYTEDLRKVLKNILAELEKQGESCTK